MRTRATVFSKTQAKNGLIHCYTRKSKDYSSPHYIFRSSIHTTKDSAVHFLPQAISSRKHSPSTWNKTPSRTIFARPGRLALISSLRVLLLFGREKTRAALGDDSIVVTIATRLERKRKKGKRGKRAPTDCHLCAFRSVYFFSASRERGCMHSRAVVKYTREESGPCR